MAMQEESDSMSLLGPPEPGPEVAPCPGFKEVVACLMRDSPSLAPIEAPPETRPPDVMMGPRVTTMYATQIVQDKATRVTYIDIVTASGGNGPWESLHGSQPPRAHNGGHH